jgi:hypothetical protein
MLERHPLYPEVEPRQSGNLAVDCTADRAAA